MGEHKHNPNCQLAKEGKLPPKPERLSKREVERRVQAMIRQATGIDRLESELSH